VTRRRVAEWGAVGLRLAIGAVLVYASISKILHPDQFADAVANYRLLPLALVSWTAIVLPWLELITGVCLILGLAVRSAALVSLVMFVVFAGALVSVLARHLDIACGCFNVSSSSTDGVHSLWISAALILGSLGILLAGDRASLLSVARLGAWSEKTRRRILYAVGAVLGALLVVTVVATATGQNGGDVTVARGGSAGNGSLTLLALRDLTSEEALAGFQTAQPTIDLRAVRAKTPAGVLQQLEGGTRADVVECSLDQVPWLVKQGYIQPLDPARLPQWDRIPAVLRDFPGLSTDGATYAAPLDSVDVGIIYRTDRVESVPTSFRDVFASRFRGRAAMENDATMGLRLGAVAISGTAGRELSTPDLEQAVRFLKSKEQRLLKHFKDSYELEGLFLMDQVDIAAGDRATARKLAEAGVPVAFAVPREGLLVRGRGLALAADCSDLDAAYAFIEHSLEASSAAAGASPQAAVAADFVLVTAPASWDEWKQAWQEVVPAKGFG
jgi:spermidine/putrescine-binding protein/uncharacterized membrane protein YphA (DoxX/SURF4 family)